MQMHMRIIHFALELLIRKMKQQRQVVTSIDFLSFLFQDCIQVAIDGKRHSVTGGFKKYGVYDGQMVTLEPPVASELKDDQWLGVEVKSQGPGEKVIVCAHRYVQGSTM